jgi:hypothetical protein
MSLISPTRTLRASTALAEFRRTSFMTASTCAARDHQERRRRPRPWLAHGQDYGHREVGAEPRGAVDGSQDPRGVLLHDVDATAADAEGIIGRIGRATASALILGAGHTLASIDDALLDRGIILETITANAQNAKGPIQWLTHFRLRFSIA